jgi:GR25 family glycosyltransferase involved in LPS biosynthesis
MFKILGNLFANKGFYINLESSVERKQHVENLILKFDIEGLYRFEALSDEMIQYSCTKSHLEIFKKSLNENLDVIFVSEDDFDIQEEWTNFIIQRKN